MQKNISISQKMEGDVHVGSARLALVKSALLITILHMKLFAGYSKAPKQPQSSARPICQFHTMTNTGGEPAAIRIAAYIGARRATHYATGVKEYVNLTRPSLSP